MRAPAAAPPAVHPHAARSQEEAEQGACCKETARGARPAEHPHLLRQAAQRPGARQGARSACPAWRSREARTLPELCAAAAGGAGARLDAGRRPADERAARPPACCAARFAKHAGRGCAPPRRTAAPRRPSACWAAAAHGAARAAGPDPDEASEHRAPGSPAVSTAQGALLPGPAAPAGSTQARPPTPAPVRPHCRAPPRRCPPARAPLVPAPAARPAAAAATQACAADQPAARDGEDDACEVGYGATPSQRSRGGAREDAGSARQRLISAVQRAGDALPAPGEDAGLELALSRRANLAAAALLRPVLQGGGQRPRPRPAQGGVPDAGRPGARERRARRRGWRGGDAGARVGWACGRAAAGLERRAQARGLRAGGRPAEQLAAVHAPPQRRCARARARRARRPGAHGRPACACAPSVLGPRLECAVFVVAPRRSRSRAVAPQALAGGVKAASARKRDAARKRHALLAFLDQVRPAPQHAPPALPACATSAEVTPRAARRSSSWCTTATARPPQSRRRRARSSARARRSGRPRLRPPAAARLPPRPARRAGAGPAVQMRPCGTPAATAAAGSTNRSQTACPARRAAGLRSRRGRRTCARRRAAAASAATSRAGRATAAAQAGPAAGSGRAAQRATAPTLTQS